jgi:hypothetical protein
MGATPSVSRIVHSKHVSPLTDELSAMARVTAATTTTFDEVVQNRKCFQSLPTSKTILTGRQLECWRCLPLLGLSAVRLTSMGHARFSLKGPQRGSPASGSQL